MNGDSFKSLGCKVNYSDTRAAAARIAYEDGRPAEVIGTCCVTTEAEKQSRKEVRRALRRVGPGGRVYVTGCAARLVPDSFDVMSNNVTVLLDYFQESAALTRGRLLAFLPALDGNSLDRRGSRRIRFFLKIQDGCDNMCAYCVVPLVRGRPRSLPLAQVIKLAREVVKGSCLEIVVCGINVGAWRDGKHGLADLLDELARIEGLARIRLSSIEAVHLSPELLEVMSGSSVICPHLHVPLQSGDDRMLKAMGRRYNREEFSRRLAAVRQALPGINLTTDAIVGFPGEGKAAFEKTLAFVNAAGFSKVHVFLFSPRPGTRAAQLDDCVPAAEKKRRSRKLLELSGRLGNRHRQRKVGCLSEVLLESAVAPGILGGYSADYTRFRVAQAGAAGLVNVRAEAVCGESVLGNMVNRAGGDFD